MNQDLGNAYRLYIKEQLFRQSRTGCLVSMSVVPPGVVLDYFVYPGQLEVLASIRILCSLTIALLYLLHWSRIGERYSHVLPFSWPMVLSISVCAMVYYTDGATSLYYSGLNIVLIGIIFILPLQLLQSIIFSALTILSYLSTCLLAGNIREDFPVFYSNINFLILTAAVSCLVSHVNSNNHFREFQLSFELEQKNERLTRLEKLRTNFFSNISHELRTPLTLILSPVQDLLERDEGLPGHVRRTLDTMLTNALRLLKLVNDLLEVIRIEEGKSNLHLKPILLDSFMHDLVDSVSHLAEKNSIKVTYDLKCSELLVLGDVYALERIFINLIHNAIKFSHRNSAIHIASRREGDTVRVAVIDHGIGIPPEELPFIFDRFRQADSSSTRQHQGSGLGLSLAKDLVEQLDGDIEVDSTFGSGTRFTVSFPLYGIEEQSAAAALPSDGDNPIFKLYRLANRSGMLHLDNELPAALPPQDGADALPQHCVLVVEDEDDLREYLVTALGDSYEVLQAVDGEDAWRILGERRPDLVLLDLMLPKVDGLDLCGRIKQDARLRPTKVILLTARIDEKAKITALDRGADDFLTKPFSTLEVKTRIRNLLRIADVESALRSSNDELATTLQELKQAQARLIQSEKTNALEHLSAGILHEINNPLNYTLTALQLAKGLPEARGNELLGEILEDMNEGMCRIKDIVSDLKTFAHPSAVDRQTAFKLAQAIRTTLSFTLQDASAIEVLDETDKEVQVIGSRNHIVQVLINLVTNGLKAIKAAGDSRKGQLRLRTEVQGERLLVSVRDNGIGIAQDIVDKIFDPFFTTRDVGEGMGLGLAVSQTIIRAHDGELRARSVQGEWTEFSFDLALAARTPT